MPEPSDLAMWQPAFAELGVPIFPVALDKKPAVKGYLSLRVPQAKQYALGVMAAIKPLAWHVARSLA